MTEKITGKQRIFHILLVAAIVLGAVLVSFKMIFWSFFGSDDTLFLMMAIRKAEGGKIFGDMWDIFSVSSLFPSFLVRIFYFFTGSYDGIVIFLKAVGVLIHLFVSGVLFGTIKKHIPSLGAFIISTIFFVIYPRLYSFPDFTNVSLWCITLMCCLLSDLHLKSRSYIRVILISALFCICVLAYPTMFCLLPFVVWGLCIAKENRGRRLITFFLTAFIICVSFLLYLQFSTGISNVISNLFLAVRGDGVHIAAENESGENKWVSIAKSLLLIIRDSAIIYAVSILLSFVWRLICKERYRFKTSFILISGAVSVLPAAFHWFVMQDSFSCTKVYFFVIALNGGIMLFSEGRKMFGERYPVAVFLYSLCVGYFAVAAVSSSLVLTVNLPYAECALIFSLFIVFKRYCKENTLMTFASILIITVVLIGGSGLTLQGSYMCNNILNARRLITYGPAKGTYVDTTEDWFWSCQLAEYEQNVNEGESVLIVLNNIQIPLNTMYLSKNNIISSHSFAIPPVYNETYRIYWEKYPEREPAVIAVDKTFGEQGYFKEGEWIYEYTMDNYELSATSEYMDFYRKK